MAKRRWRQAREKGSGKGSGVWREAAKKKERREGDGARGQGRQLGGRRGLSAFDVKSLRQKRSGPECGSTCSGNPRWRRQRGDGEDEGVEIKRGRKNRHEGDKMRKSQETRRRETLAGSGETGNFDKDVTAD